MRRRHCLSFDVVVAVIKQRSPAAALEGIQMSKQGANKLAAAQAQR